MIGKNVRALVVSAAAFATILSYAPAKADLIDPADPFLTNFTIQQGDFNTVALQWADTVFGGTKYLVQSGPGQIHNYVVPYTGSS